MIVKNSLKQLSRTPLKTMSFLGLITLACTLLAVGANLWVRNQNSRRNLEELFMTIGTVEQKASSVAQRTVWNAEIKDYEIRQSPEYAQIYPVSVLDFEGAEYIQEPEKRSYYASYAPDYTLAGGNFSSAATVVEFSPVEDCMPDESVKIEIKKVIGGLEAMQGTRVLFCDHENENPEPLYADRTYTALISIGNWAHGSNINPQDNGREPEYSPLAPVTAQYNSDGTLMEDPLKDLQAYYEVTPGFYETKIGKRYLNMGRAADLLGKIFPVTGTNCTELLQPFYDGNAYIMEGEDISQESYAAGNRECLVSDVFAENNGLGIGDDVTVRLCYTNAKYAAEMNFNYSGGGSYDFLPLDAEGEVVSVFEEAEYKIVGIYTMSPGTSGMGGNEMIVPMNSIEHRDQCNIVSYGPMNHQTTSFQIPNGTIEDYMKEWEKLGITDLDITFYDRGYSQLQAGMENMRSVSLILVLSGGGMGLALIFLINHLFVSSQKKKTAVERCLGLSKRKSMLSLLAGIYLMLIVGNAAGGVLGYVLAQNISAEHFENEAYDLTYSNGNALGSGSMEEDLETDTPGRKAAVSVVCAGVLTLAGMGIMPANAGRILTAEPFQMLAEARRES